MTDKKVELEEIGQEKAKELLSASLGAFYMLAETLNNVAPLVQALEDVLKQPVSADRVKLSDTGIVAEVAKEDGDGSDKLNRESDKGTPRSD